GDVCTQLAHLRQRGEVGDEAFRVALGAQLVDQLLRAARIAAVSEDDMPGADQLEGDVAAEAGGGAGDQDGGHASTVGTRCGHVRGAAEATTSRVTLRPRPPPPAPAGPPRTQSSPPGPRSTRPSAGVR